MTHSPSPRPAAASVWQRLQEVTCLTFSAHSQADTGWNGEGHASVRVSTDTPGVLRFEEQGEWHNLAGARFRFTNTFRWTRLQGRLRLEHLRHGHDRPVLLFELAPQTDTDWAPLSPHQCAQDVYAASLHMAPSSLILDWTIQGPAKRETLRYRYTTA